MQVSAGGSHIHHHGLLSGLGAGAVAVLAVFGLLLMAWHAIGHAVGVAGNVIVWAVAAVILATAAYAMLFLFLRARHHVAHPETLIRQPVRTEAIPVQVVAGDIPAGPPAAALPPGWKVLPADPDDAIAMIRAIAGRAVIPGTAGDGTTTWREPS
jgi:hypothetical protein